MDELLRRHPGLAAVPRGDADLTLVDGERANARIRVGFDVPNFNFGEKARASDTSAKMPKFSTTMPPIDKPKPPPKPLTLIS